MTTAEARNKAYDCYEKRWYNLAAIYYRIALEAYPSHHPKNELAIKDKSYLERRLKSSLNAVKQGLSK